MIGFVIERFTVSLKGKIINRLQFFWNSFPNYSCHISKLVGLVIIGRKLLE